MNIILTKAWRAPSRLSKLRFIPNYLLNLCEQRKMESEQDTTNALPEVPLASDGSPISKQERRQNFHEEDTPTTRLRTEETPTQSLPRNFLSPPPYRPITPVFNSPSREKLSSYDSSEIESNAGSPAPDVRYRQYSYCLIRWTDF